MKLLFVLAMLGGQEEPQPPRPPVIRVLGSMVVENLPPYGHPGTPFSVVRHNAEADAIASVARFSSRTLGETANPGFGGCITFQGSRPYGEGDMDYGHLCFVLNELGGVRVDLWARDSQGGYRIVQSWDADAAPLTRKED